MNYEDAKQKLKILQEYISLVDNYSINTLQDLIIRQYAIHNSISKVIRDIKVNNLAKNLTSDTEIITHDLIRETILSKPKDSLHSLIQKEYKLKTRPQRRKRK